MRVSSSTFPLNHWAYTLVTLCAIKQLWVNMCAFKHVYSNCKLSGGFTGMYVCPRLSLKPATTLSECESPRWRDVMCHLGDTRTQRTDTSCSLGKRPHGHTIFFLHTNTLTLHKWPVMDGCFCETAGKEWGVWESENVYFCVLPVGTTTLTP